MPTERLGAADMTWLRLDRPENHLVVTGVLELDGPLDVAGLRAVLAERLTGPHPRFRSRVRRPRLPFGRPRWEPDPAFDLDAHLPHTDLSGGGDDELERLVGTLLEQGFDASEGSPWRLVVVDGYRPAPGAEPVSVVVARLHHCLADGAALVRLLLDVTDPAHPVDPVERPTAEAAPDGGAGRRPDVVRPRGGVARRLRLAVDVPVTAVRLLLRPAEPRTPLRGLLGRAKGAAWAPPRPLAEVKAAARTLGATVNDVLLAAVGGGLRRYLQEVAPGRALPARLRVYVPVDLDAGTDPAGTGPAGTGRRTGNRFGLVPLALPVAEADRRARVAAVVAATRRAKRSAFPVASFVLVGVLGVLPGPLRQALAALLGARATAVVTNVPGPRHTRTLAGTRVTRIAFWVPQAADVGVGVSLFSYDGTVRIGVAADSRLVPDAARLARAVDAELAALLGPLAPPR